MALFLKIIITFYRYTFSIFIGRQCRYLPTCSEYSEQAINKYGAYKGSLLAITRIISCNPKGGSGFDPVPDNVPEYGWRFWRYLQRNKLEDK